MTDPEGEGIPSVADDTSTAYDDDRYRADDDTARGIPLDEPVAVDEYGNTAEEALRDEPLGARLLREEPDISPDDPETPWDEGIADEALTEEAARQAAIDADVLATPADWRPPERVGRLIDPDLGGPDDREPQALATDTGETHGLTAEEDAINEIPE